MDTKHNRAGVWNVTQSTAVDKWANQRLSPLLASSKRNSNDITYSIELQRTSSICRQSYSSKGCLLCPLFDDPSSGAGLYAFVRSSVIRLPSPVDRSPVKQQFWRIITIHEYAICSFSAPQIRNQFRWWRNQHNPMRYFVVAVDVPKRASNVDDDDIRAPCSLGTLNPYTHIYSHYHETIQSQMNIPKHETVRLLM